MKWIVKIENKPEQRILVLFNAIEEKIQFYGQYRIKSHWIDFSIADCDMNVSLDILQEILLKVSEEMELRVKKHEDLTKSFAYIKTIEIVDETQNKPDSNQVYGFEPL